MRSRRQVIGHDNALHLANAAENYQAFPVLSRFDRVVGLKHALRLRNCAEVFGDKAERPGFIEFPGNEQDGVIGLVIVSIERLKTFDRYVLDVAARADCGLAVVVPEKCSRHDALFEHIHGRILSALELVSHHRHFAIEVFLGNKRIHHAVGFQIQSPFEIGIRGLKSFEVVGAVEPRRPVRTRSVVLEFLRNIGMVSRSFEQQMLEQVGHSRLAVVFLP